MNKILLAILLSFVQTPCFAITASSGLPLSPDQTARILAGMDSQSKMTVYGDWEANSPKQRLIQEFSRMHMPEAYNNTQTVFYPFGGPDVIFPSLFFPNMKTLVLAGLERPGALPTNLTSASAAQKIAEIRRAYSSVFSYGYYITSKMGSDLREFGTTTMISVGLVMLGNTIMSVESGPRSVKVTYSTPQNPNDVRQVYYFQQDLSDKNISPAFIQFVQSLNIDTTFYKASSYVPQMNGFSKVNALALNGRYFVQSDTGIRISDLAHAGDWSVHLFGQYVRPSSIFGIGVQPGLAWAYANSVCRSGDSIAKKQFIAIWAKDPCTVRMTSEGQISTYDGPLSFPYDYASKLSPINIRSFASSFIYAVRK